MRLISVLCLTFFFLCPAVLAAETPWQSLAPGVSIRLIGTGQVDDDGKTLVALEIDMPDSTKTYWRVPGETGLPADLDFSDSVGIVDHQQFWPYPLREEKAEKTDYVYYGHTVLPIELTISDPSGIVDVLATLGICSEICVPARARLRLPLTAGPPDAPNGLRIRQAMAAVPISWTDEPHPIGRVVLMADATAIGIGLEQAGVDATSLIAATSTGEPLFGAPQKSPHGDLVVLPILGKSDNSALDGMEVEITFMTEMGAYVVSRTVEAGYAASTSMPDQ